MEILERVIQSLTSDEVRRFKILSNRFKADEEKKLIVLFDAIRSEKFEGKEDDLLIEVYGSAQPETKNRFYRLRNKLLDSIEKSLVFYHFKYKESIHALYDIQLSIMFKERGYYELASYFLRKAEKKAEALDQFTILELVYEEFVQLGIRNVDIDLESILDKRKRNVRKLEIHRKNTEAIAVIKQEIRHARFGKEKLSVQDLLDRLKEELEESEDIFHSPEGKIQIFQTISTLLHNKGAYRQLAEYLTGLIHEFEEKHLFNKDNHNVRLLMRLRLIISLYKTWKLEEAIAQLNIFENEMSMYSRQNYQTYLFNYYNISIFNLKMLGREEEARKLIDEAMRIPEIKNDTSHSVIILVSLAGIQFNEKDYKGALQTLEQIRASRTASHLSEEFFFFVEVFYLVCLLEEGRNTAFIDVFKQFRKRFKAFLKMESHARTLRFSEILDRMNNAAIEGRKVSIRSTTEGYVQAFGKETPTDNEIIDPVLYLRSLNEKRPYYELYQEDVRKKMVEA